MIAHLSPDSIKYADNRPCVNFCRTANPQLFQRRAFREVWTGGTETCSSSLPRCFPAEIIRRDRRPRCPRADDRLGGGQGLRNIRWAQTLVDTRREFYVYSLQWPSWNKLGGKREWCFELLEVREDYWHFFSFLVQRKSSRQGWDRWDTSVRRLTW